MPRLNSEATFLEDNLFPPVPEYLKTILLTVSLVASIVLTIAHYSVFVASSKYDQPSLQFRQAENLENAWKFKILQITDIHLGEAEDTLWGPEQDRKTWIVLDKVLTMESPDLIVLGGDQLTANNCKTNATAYYRILGEFLSGYGIPWAMIFGNHDDMDFEVPGTDQRIPHKYSRRQLLAVDQSFSLSLSRGGPLEVTGTSNYVLDIHIENQTAAQIFFFDSGGGYLPQAIDDSQIKWFHEKASLSQLPAGAFQHIPTAAHHFSESSCQGFQGEGIAAIHYDAGIMKALADSGRFSFLAVGHNHGNDYCCPYEDSELHVCFGRHSGYGGYGKWEHGARVYELSIPTDQASRNTMQWKSWVRLESGEIVDEISR
jgi:DNA repair exonuclease SbcCD nuclease subunit